MITTATNDIDCPWTLPNFLFSRITRAFVAVILIYVTLAVMLPTGWLAEVMRCVQVTLAFVVCLGYYKGALTCFFVVGRWPEKHNVIALGIELSWASLMCNGLWAIFWRLSGQPPWMVNNDYYTAWTAVSAFAAGLHILAPNLIGANLPVLDRARYGAAFLLGLALIVIVGFWRPDLSHIAHWLHDKMAEPEWLARGLLNEWLRARAWFTSAF